MRYLMALFVMCCGVANADIYRVVEEGIVHEYNVEVTQKDKSAISKDIFIADEEMARIDAEIASLIEQKGKLQNQKSGLEAILEELNAATEVIVDETIYPDLNSGSSINW